MTPKHESDTKVALEGLMQENGFTAGSRFYRATLPEFLSPTDQPGVFQISAMDDPSEAVVDVYGQGHVTLAQQIGPGLAFSESADHEWLASDRTAVEVTARRTRSGRTHLSSRVGDYRPNLVFNASRWQRSGPRSQIATCVPRTSVVRPRSGLRDRIWFPSEVKFGYQSETLQQFSNRRGECHER